MLTVSIRKKTDDIPTDRKVVYVKNIGINTSEDCLSSFMEATTGVQVTRIEYGQNQDALVTFDFETGGYG